MTGWISDAEKVLLAVKAEWMVQDPEDYDLCVCTVGVSFTTILLQSLERLTSRKTGEFSDFASYTYQLRRIGESWLDTETDLWVPSFKDTDVSLQVEFLPD